MKVSYHKEKEKARLFLGCGRDIFVEKEKIAVRIVAPRKGHSMKVGMVTGSNHTSW